MTTEEQLERLFECTETLTDCVCNLVLANRDMFQMLSIVSGMREGLQERDPLPEDMVKVDLTGKPVVPK